MSRSLGGHVMLSKQELLDRSEAGFVEQVGAEIVDDSFELPQVERSLITSLPSIETFVVSPDRSMMATGMNELLNAAWEGSARRLIDIVFDWATAAGVEVLGDSYLTMSITPADQVNGEAHFDDAQFDPGQGVGLVAIVGDLGGSSVASAPIPHSEIRPHQQLSTTAAMVSAFAYGGYGRADFAANQVIVLPQFGQLHSGPGPCGSPDELRHLMVFRAATAPR